MKKHIVLLSMIVLLLAGTHLLYTDEDHQHDEGVTNAMHKILPLYKDLKSDIENEDYYQTALHLMELAKQFKALETVTPKKGTKKDWNINHNAIITECFKGIGACGNKDIKTVKKHYDQITKLYKKGHAKFK